MIERSLKRFYFFFEVSAWIFLQIPMAAVWIFGGPSLSGRWLDRLNRKADDLR